MVLSLEEFRCSIDTPARPREVIDAAVTLLNRCYMSSPSDLEGSTKAIIVASEGLVMYSPFLGVGCDLN